MEREDETWTPIPELYRFEFLLRPGQGKELHLGRTAFEESSGYIASGLFVGLSASFDAGKNNFTLGAFYTGFLYKKTAHIAVSDADMAVYDTKLDYEDIETYFAPRHALFGANGEFPGLIAQRDTLALSLLGQMDLSKADEKIHSQYLAVKYFIPVKNRFEFTVDGAAEMLEISDEIGWAFAGSAEAAWLPPTAIRDRLFLGYRWSSGRVNDTVLAFTPINAVSQGEVLKARLSGLSMIRGGYAARLFKSLSTDISALYFLRTDLTTFQDHELDSNSSPFVGAEAYASLSWVPVMDVSFVLGGGAFIPGPALISESKIRWLVSLGTILSF
jgi:hypothetical protein